MITRVQLVAEALSWEGTPAHWQQCVKGRACDCFSLIWGIAREIGMPEAKSFDFRFQNYRRDFSGEFMLKILRETLVPTNAPQPGDVMAIRIKHSQELPRHLAMIVSETRMIHCYGLGPRRAIVVPIGKSRPIHSFWTWPSLAGV